MYLYQEQKRVWVFKYQAQNSTFTMHKFFKYQAKQESLFTKHKIYCLAPVLGAWCLKGAEFLIS